MNHKLTLLANLVSRLAGSEDEESQAETLLRLQKISDRLNNQTRSVPSSPSAQTALTAANNCPDDYMNGQLAAKTEESTAVNHWCPGQRRFTKQSVRNGEQLKGVATCFEIDPISKLKD